MKKQEIIRELEKNGCFDSEMYSMTKKDLEEKLNNVKKAQKMSLSDLLAHLK